MNSNLTMQGKLSIKPNLAKRVSLKWRLANWLTIRFLWNCFTYHLAKIFSKVTKIPTWTGRLHIVKHHGKDGSRTNYGWAAYGLVTDAFVEFMVDQLQAETAEWGDFKFHESGTGVVAANVADVDIGNPSEAARDTGTQIEGATAEIYKSVATVDYTGGFAITEHGIFSTLAAATLLDRHVFGAINVINLDSIVFTYELTCNSGG